MTGEKDLELINYMELAMETIFGKTEIWIIDFIGKEMLFVGDKDKLDGAITTREKLENFEPSLAHLKPYGVMHYGRVVMPVESVSFIKIRRHYERTNTDLQM